MIYLNDTSLADLGINWDDVVTALSDSVKTIAEGDFAQPIKPYLRYKNEKNRIIAMPAYVGGNASMAGLKWIASFPENLHINLPRAHSVLILNDSATGVPVGVINAALLSSIRTAGVSALMMQYSTPMVKDRITCGIVGFGPIGRMHLNMLLELYNERIERVIVHDLNGVDIESIPEWMRSRVELVDNPKDVFGSDVVITCTVSTKRYFSGTPARGSLHLNVSLRDYESSFLKHVDHMVVDDWDEVCRENTDIEAMHKEQGLMPEATFSLVDVVVEGALDIRKPEDVVMFNPMGMAVFDVALGAHYLRRAEKMEVGVVLE